jgi:signal transduction histidine kinase/ligand-binding sensor domain-containing protein
MRHLKSFLRMASVCLFLMGVQEAFPQQDHSISRFTVSEGLSQSTVNAIGQDPYGFIWVSTGDGLTCYDGSKFEQYYSPAAVFGTGAGNRMRHIISDSIGNLWIGTDQGLLYLNRDSAVIEIPFPEINAFRKKPCIPLFCSADSLSVLVIHEGIIVVNLKTYLFRQIPIQRQVGNLKMHNPDLNEKWFGLSPSAINIVESTNGVTEITEFQFPDHPLDQLNGIALLSADRYIISAVNELYIFNRRTGKLTSLNDKTSRFMPENALFFALLKDKDGDIWIGTSQHGIFIVDTNFSLKQQLEFISDGSSKPYLIQNLTNLFEDMDGNIWFGTDGYGVGVITKNNNKFSLFDRHVDKDGEALSLFTRCFYEDDDQDLYIGTSFGGIIRWQRNTNLVNRWLIDKGNSFPSANDIYCITPFLNTDLFLGTSKGIWVFNKLSQTGFQLIKPTGSNQIERVTQIMPYGDDYLAIINNQVKGFTNNIDQCTYISSPFPDTAIIHLLDAHRNSLLGFSTEGFYSLEGGILTYNPYLYENQKIVLKVNSVLTISDTSFWLASGMGLLKMSTSGAVTEFYGVREGLANHYLYGILTDDDGHLWISSNKGLSKFNPDTKQFVNYDMESGLQSLEFNSGAFYKSRSGEMFFGGINGFNYFFPDSVNQMKPLPKTLIRSLKVNDLPFLPDTSILAKKHLSLAYSENTIAFEYQAIDFSGREGHSYFYFMEGHDKNWIQAGTITQARYSRLRPGRYIFRVKAVGISGYQDGKEASIVVNIMKPFWMTWPFIFAVASILILIIVYVVQYFATRKIKKQIALLERQREISIIRRRIGSDLHDDIGSGLSRLAMMTDTVKSMVGNNAQLEGKLDKIVTHARHMIDQLRVIVWALNPQYDQLENLIAYIHQHMSEFIEEFPVTYNILLPKNIPIIQITPEFKRNVFYTLKEAVHNSLKHSDTDEILIDIVLENDHFIARVTDKGNGFDKAITGASGNGLRFMEKRMNDLGGSLNIISSAGKGTLVEMKIPMSNSH